MKTNIRKFPAVLLLAVLCLTVFPISAMAAGVAEVKIPVSVELSGEKPSPDETYTIILQGEDEAPMPEENILTVTGAGKAEFPFRPPTKARPLPKTKYKHPWSGF